MMNIIIATRLPLFPGVETACQDMESSFERFCLTAGIDAANPHSGFISSQKPGVFDAIKPELRRRSAIEQ